MRRSTRIGQRAFAHLLAATVIGGVLAACGSGGDGGLGGSSSNSCRATSAPNLSSECYGCSRYPSHPVFYACSSGDQPQDKGSSIDFCSGAQNWAPGDYCCEH